MFFSKSTIVASLFALCAVATPLSVKPDADIARRGDFTPWSPNFSFDRWGGHDSLIGFDNFWGRDNFSGFVRGQVVVKDRELVCHKQEIVIVQQRLTVLRELAKRILVEHICDVETQVIVFQQWHAGLGHFKSDLRRISGRRVGFDHAIAGRFNELFEADGRLTTHNFGFRGDVVGKNTVVFGGDNWEDSRSFQTVNEAYFASRHAHRLSNGRFDSLDLD